MNERKRSEIIIEILKEKYPEPKTALDYSNPFELLVAAVLSAQCTDKRVNEVTSELFDKYEDAGDFAEAPPEELEEDIRSTGFYRNKAKNIKNAARIIVEKHGGKVPDTMEELTDLPGVARKTANVVLGNAFGKREGIVVDTHVKRISRRLGFTQEKSPPKIEKDLMEIVPEKDWTDFSHLLIFHGRETCKARKPLCGRCVIAEHCPSRDSFD